MQIVGLNMSLKTNLESLAEAGIEHKFLGFLNIESNVVSLSTRSFDFCEECLGTNQESLQFECIECGRNQDNYLFVGSGDGDGIYVVNELFIEGIKVGLFAVFDSNYGLANMYRQLIQDGQIPKFELEQVSKYFSTHFSRLGELSVGASILIGDQYNTDDKTDIYVTLHIDDLNTSKYQVGGFFELPEEYSFVDELGPRANPTLRVLLALEKSVYANTPFIEEKVVESWGGYLHGQLSQIVTSHLEPMADSVRDLNTQLESLSSGSTSKREEPRYQESAESAGTSALARGKFCAFCGTKFDLDSANFCSSCGGPRQVSA